MITCSVTEQIVADHISRVTSAWKAPETCGARVVVCRSNVILAEALGNIASELIDADGVPLAKFMSQMHPFEDDGSSPGSFPDRLTLDLLPFYSAPIGQCPDHSVNGLQYYAGTVTVAHVHLTPLRPQE